MVKTVASVMPKTRKGRAGTARPSTILLDYGNSADISEALRLQRLLGLGIAGHRAKLIAETVWGAARHG